MNFLRPPRISRLPTGFETPLSWSASELSELQYSHLEEAVDEQQNDWAELHASLIASSPGCGVTQEELSWAMGVAYSRAFRRDLGRVKGNALQGGKGKGGGAQEESAD